MAVIGGFRSDLSITPKADGSFGNVSAGILFSKVAYQRSGKDNLQHLQQSFGLSCVDFLAT